MDIEQRLKKYLGTDPSIADTAYIAKQAILLGDVRIGDQSSVWPGCVLRGDINSISIGDRSNIQANIKKMAAKYVKVATAHKTKFQ